MPGTTFRLSAIMIGVAAVTGGWAPAASAAGTPPATICHACGRDLIANPGGETAPGSTDDNVVKVPDWKATGDFTTVQYSAGGDLSPTSPGPPNRGKNYFYGGPYALKSTGSQVIIVGTSGVTSGKVSFVLSGWLGGYADQGDYTTLTATFESAAGLALRKVTIGPVTAPQRHDISELLYRQATGVVPAATKRITGEMAMIKLFGGDDDGLADNLSLVFTYD